MNFLETLRREPRILFEGGVVERLRRRPGLKLDPHVGHTAFLFDPAARSVMASIYKGYLAVAERFQLPLALLAPTWRANGERLGRAGLPGVGEVSREAVRFLREIGANSSGQVFIGGLMACRGDAYKPNEAMREKAAARFHAPQAGALCRAGVDFLMASTLPAHSEAAGMARAMSQTGCPYVLSFVVRPDGRLLDGAELPQVIRAIDLAVSPPPTGYMVNCVHPEILDRALQVLAVSSPLPEGRLMGIQANASRLSPEELEGRENLDSEGVESFARSMGFVAEAYRLKILGGCCGTSEEHIEAVARWMTARRRDP